METLGKNKKSGLFSVPCDLWRCLKTAIVRSGKEGERKGRDRKESKGASIYDVPTGGGMGSINTPNLQRTVKTERGGGGLRIPQF